MGISGQSQPVRALQDCGHLILGFLICGPEKGDTCLPGLGGEGGKPPGFVPCGAPILTGTILH